MNTKPTPGNGKPVKKILKKKKKPGLPRKRKKVIIPDELSEEWMDILEVMALFRKSRATIRNMRNRGDLVGSKQGNSFLYNKKMVHDLLRNNLGK